jgi:hypothetical protein
MRDTLNADQAVVAAVPEPQMPQAQETGVRLRGIPTVVRPCLLFEFEPEPFDTLGLRYNMFRQCL